MLIFGNDKNTRGCFLVQLLHASDTSRGAQLELPDGSKLPEDDYAFPLTVTGFSFNQIENVSYVKCFGDYVYTYAFGHDPGSQLVVQFAGMMQPGKAGNVTENATGGDFGPITDTILAKYDKARLYNSLGYAKLAVGGSQVLKGFVVGMQSVTMSPELSIQQFNITIQLVEAQGR